MSSYHDNLQVQILISSNRFVYFQTIRNFVCYYNEQGSYSLRNLT